MQLKPFTLNFPAKNFKVIQIKCAICGTQIKPWFEVCYGCYNPLSKDNGRISEPIIAHRFMKEMKIDGW